MKDKSPATVESKSTELHRPARLLYSLPEVCEATGLGRTMVKQLIHSGELDSIKVGRRRLVPVESINRFIQSRLANCGTNL